MEENLQGQTVNLGGFQDTPVHIEGVVPPVSVEISNGKEDLAVAQHMTSQVVMNTAPITEPVYNAVINTAPQPTFNAVASTVVNATMPNVTVEAPVQAETQPVAQEELPKEPVIRDKFIVPSMLLKTMLNGAKKVGNYNPFAPKSQVLCMTLDSNGIEFRASDGKIDVKLLDTNYRYNQTLSATVDIKMFSDVIANVDCDDVELLFDTEKQILTVLTATGTAKFPQRIDASTRGPINITLEGATSYDNMIRLNIDDLIRILSQTKPVREFAKQIETMDGVYFGDIVITTDRLTMLLMDNITSVKNGGFLIGSKFCDLLCSLDFNNENCRIGFTVDPTGVVKGITVSDNRTTICGPVETRHDINVDVCMNFWNNNFDKKITIDTRKFINALKRVIPFIVPVADDGDVLKFIISDNTLTIKSKNGGATETLGVTSVTPYQAELNLSAGKVLKILQSVKSATFDLTMQDGNNMCICLAYDDYKCVMAVAY